MTPGLVAAVVIVVSWGRAGPDAAVRDPTSWLGLLGPRNPSSPTRVAWELLLLAGLGAFALAWWRLQRLAARHELSLRGAWTTALLWSLPFLVGPPLASRDVYAYAAQGELAARGLDPTVVPVSALGPGRLLDAVDPLWHHSLPPYGGLAVAIERAAAVVAGGNPVGTVVVLRGLAAIAVLLTGFAAVRLVRPGRRPLVLVLVLANPLVLIYLISGAHLDAVAMALLICGLLVARTSRPAGVALCCLAATVKFPAVVGATWLALLGARRAWSDPRTRRAIRTARSLVTDGAAAVAAVAAATALGGGGLHWLGNFGTPGEARTRIAPVEALAATITWLTGLVGTPPEEATVRGTARLLGAVVAVVVVGWLLVRQCRSVPGGRGEAEIGSPGLAAALLAIAVLGPVVYPWYVALALPLLAVGGMRSQRWLCWGSLALTVTQLPPLHPFATLLAGPGGAVGATVLAAAGAATLALWAWAARGQLGLPTRSLVGPERGA
ncbi:MAG: polyprenol phosphomannose-dependent alpha 1,6 mannosyltransferase MptB [Frankiaceae bacterium]